jgi:hypothetical protein
MHSTLTVGGVRGLLATPGCLCKASVTANNTRACCRGRHRLQRQQAYPALPHAAATALQLHMLSLWNK